MAYGIQDDGTFQRKPVDVIREDLRQAFRNEAGEDVELRPGSPAAQMLDAAAVEIADQWAAAEAAYYASYYGDAFGEQLDKKLAEAGFSRLPLRPATGEVEFSRDDPASEDITVDEGTVVTTQRTDLRPAIPFETTEDVLLAVGETSVTAPIEALKPWQTELDEEWLGEETNVASDTITEFDTPVANIDDVTNPLPTGDPDEGFTEGRDRETDAEFKLRYETTLAEGGVSTRPAMESSILAFDDDIVSVKVEEVRDAQTGYGPEVTVLAPDVGDDDIAQAILESRAAGTESIGDDTGTGEMSDGTEVSESFNRATRADIYVDVTITTSETYPDDGDTQIEDGIIRYIGGDASDGVTYTGLEIGEDVVFDQVFRRVLEVAGVVEADIEIEDADPPTTTSNVTIGDLEAAMTASANIDISEA